MGRMRRFRSCTGRFADPEVVVDGQAAGGKPTVLDAIDPALPADRVVHTVTNTAFGLTAERRVHAYANAFHDNYHLITYRYCNTGNTDGDAAVELPGQRLYGCFGCIATAAVNRPRAYRAMTRSGGATPSTTW